MHTYTYTHTHSESMSYWYHSLRQSCHCSRTRSTVLFCTLLWDFPVTPYHVSARYTFTLYFQVIILVTATVSDWVLFAWFPVKFEFKLYSWLPPQLLLTKKDLNHDITVCRPSECVWQNKREQSSPCYLTLTPCMASHNPADVFSSSHWLSWWNICSVVNGFIVAKLSWGHIALKFIDLLFEWHDSSLLCSSVNVCVYCIWSL